MQYLTTIDEFSDAPYVDVGTVSVEKNIWRMCFSIKVGHSFRGWASRIFPVNYEPFVVVSQGFDYGFPNFDYTIFHFRLYTARVSLKCNGS